METKGAQTRRAILDAAITRFGRDGYRSSSVADIARDASVGSTVTYAYFPNKEALFLAALDEDAAGVISEGRQSILDDTEIADWHQRLFFTLIEAVEDHPLARRMLAGLEPEVTERVLDIPALADLRKVCADRLLSEQLAGTVRNDIDVAAMANGIVAITLSLLMAVVQVGALASSVYAEDIAGLFRAALLPSLPSVPSVRASDR